jgi:hypothetical protein
MRPNESDLKPLARGRISTECRLAVLRVLLYSPVTAFILLPAGLRAEETLSVERLKQVQGATVFLKVQGLDWSRSGSACLVRVRSGAAYLVTNYRVVQGGPGRGLWRQAVDLVVPPRITAVLRSGTRDESQVNTVEVVTFDRESDLAVLRMTGVKHLPPPLDFAPAIRVGPPLPVFVLGFSTGQAAALKQRNPMITLSKGQISGNLKNSVGDVVALRLDSILNPGTNGGPVVDRDGLLVAAVRGAYPEITTTFAIPSTVISGFLAGQVMGVRLIPLRLVDGAMEIGVHVTLADPLQRLRKVTIHYNQAMTGGQIEDRPGPIGHWSELPGNRLDLKPEHQQAHGTLQIPIRGKPRVTLAVQASVVAEDNTRTYSQPRLQALELPEPMVKSGRPAKLPPTTPRRPPNLKPPTLEGTRVVRQLPALVQEVAVGGGGRYLILHLPRVRQLAIFDVNEARVVHYVPLAGDGARFAACRDKLLIEVPGKRQIERWDLQTFRHEATGLLPPTDGIKQFLLGSNSDGPLLVDGMFINIQTLNLLSRLPSSLSEEFRMVPSADGRTYGVWQWRSGQWPLRAYLRDEDQLVEDPARIVRDTLRPGPDGSVIYAGAKQFSRRLKPLGRLELMGDCYCLPAAFGTYYLALDRRGNVPDKVPFVGVAGCDRPLVRLTSVELGDEIQASESGNLSLSERIHFLPAAKLMITVPSSNDRLILHHADIEEALAKSDTDYLFLTSGAPAPAKLGTTWTHTLTWRSRAGGVKPRLAIAPPGMVLNPEGCLTWAVPPWFDEAEILITVVLCDATGQETWHTIPVTIGD